MSFFLMCNGDVYRPSYTIGGWLFLKYSALEEKKYCSKLPVMFKRETIFISLSTEEL